MKNNFISTKTLEFFIVQFINFTFAIFFITNNKMSNMCKMCTYLMRFASDKFNFYKCM